jgi:hypothetical protein
MLPAVAPIISGIRSAARTGHGDFPHFKRYCDDNSFMLMFPIDPCGGSMATQRDRLATFLHISDLHFGKIDPATGDAEYSALATQTYSNFNSRFDGLLGHHGRALKELHAFAARLKKDEPDLRLIVSGDLSRCGDNHELRLARDYIEARIDITPPLNNLIGLRLGERARVIPGNHDQWGGTQSPFGSSPSTYGTQFPSVLPSVQRIPLANGKSIAFIEVDSDADVQPLSWKRVFALGAFESQLKKLNWLPAKSPDEVRVLLIHHSWDQAPDLRMANGSKWTLGHFLHTHQISAMLCGHSHIPLLKTFQARAGLHLRDVHELRSGSTTQLDVVPQHWKTWRNKLPAKPNWHANTLLVHRVYQRGAAMEWKTETYARGKFGFKPLPGQTLNFPLP